MEKKDNSTITAVFNDIQYTFSPTFVGENIKKLEARKKINRNYIIDEWYEEISLDDGDIDFNEISDEAQTLFYEINED